jgi:hypothetical protein
MADVSTPARPSHPDAELAILAARGLEPTDAERARIAAVRDDGPVDALLRRSLDCKSVAELLG